MTINDFAYLPGEEGIKTLHELEASGKITVRFPTAFGVHPENGLEVVDKPVRLRKQEAGGLFEIMAAKIFMDGVLEGGAAYLEEPYLHQPGNGALLWDPQKYNEMCAALDDDSLWHLPPA